MRLHSQVPGARTGMYLRATIQPTTGVVSSDPYLTNKTTFSAGGRLMLWGKIKWRRDTER